MYLPDKLNRRDFVRAGAGAACGLLLPGNLALGASRAAKREVLSPYNARKGSRYEGLVGTRCGTPNSTSGLTKFMVRSSHTAVGDIRKLKADFLNYYVTGGAETGTGTATVTAAVEYPSGVFTQILFGGQVQGAIALKSHLMCDYVTPRIMIPDGATYWIRQFHVNTVGIIYTDGTIKGGQAQNLGLGDLFNFNTPTPTDQTMGGTITNEGAGNLMHVPGAIVGMTNRPSVIAVGDSITAGFNDATGVNDCRVGMICRGFPATTLAFLNHGTAGATASATASYLTTSVNRRALWPYGSHFIEGLGHNDILANGDSAATLETNLRTNIWSQFPRGAILLRTTLTPRSTTTDSWATPGNQTASPNTSKAVTFNTSLRNGTIVGVTDFFETAWAVEDTHDLGKWISTGAAFGDTLDGIHGVPVSYAALGAVIAAGMGKISWAGG